MLKEGGKVEEEILINLFFNYRMKMLLNKSINS